MSEDEIEDSLSEIYHSLRASRRRRAVRILKSREEPICQVRELAKEIASQEHSIPRPQATGEPYRNVYNALSQTHLPTLSEARIIIYDPDRQTVSSGPNLDLAALLVEMTRPAIMLLYKEPHESLLQPKSGPQ